ncbi:nitrogen fixation/metabolism regulation signal transduction histidine kinase [Clostridium tetanomorphum]|uniref:histidine kinase n=1 Tax=Clostridium tetanomorphum TaxID=1553 RepID=A0A923EDJ9_CLOTT|nr:ATP-binding protein [Clostridium tetanomorphum]KAJ51681.1 multi-sensor signal transduction histidine kinase [Clostridium tetanomorphum DSM 665]MBC2398690.1 HAMP domain-containing protein [Clostridium tetanomorphum]MBP1864029.1 nitrogen fixation/metabolism regulation signal transduction histidine kinase [Clostridium tetanomorphum]NRS84442.1 nitrogen fixation/metabolism regulation signal transduction histidine kinase [Clostridium tetanomorphum]NRZ97656.1 nitrogen fixation/metabolism regulatio
MKLKLKRKIVLPILFLMILPTVVLSISFLNIMQRVFYDNVSENAENFLNSISERIYQVNDEFYFKQMLFSKLSSMEDLGVIVYEDNDIVYERLNEFNLDANKIKTGYTDTKRYEIKKKTYENLNISIYVVIDRYRIFLNVINIYKPYLILIAISIFISIQVIFFLTNSFSKPISILLEGYNNIISGNFKHNIDLKRKDELGLLGDAFNEMKNQIYIGSNKFLQMKRFNEDILHNISTGIITTDMVGKIKNYNDTASNIIERVICFNQKNTNIIKTLMLQINETIEKMEPVNRIEHFNEPHTKEAVYLDITTSLMKNSSGEYIGVICNFNDITSRKKIEENVERIDRLTSLGQLTAALAHEIRNPLSGIKMSAQILNKRLSSHLNTSDEYLFKAIIKETERLDLLITDLLNFSKPRIPKSQIIDVFEVLDKALLFSDKKIREKEAIVSINRDIGETLIYFDKGQLLQIFLNIISNALDAIDMNGQLKIIVEKPRESDNTYIIVSVEDNGYGIKKEYINKIFDPFFTTRESGTGLGLSVVHKLVAANNGNIQIESIESVGTIVKIYLPKYRGEIDEYKSFSN